MSQKSTERLRASNGLEKSGLLWLFSRKVAPFETPGFANKVGEVIVGATRQPRRRAPRTRKAARKRQSAK